MKIGILTQPLGNNYGGIIQAYALFRILSDLGHNTIILQRVGDEYSRSFYKTVGRHIRNFLRFFKGQDPIYYPYMSAWKRQNRELLSFVENYLNTSIYLYTSESLRDYIYENDLDAVIIGSDQVWRPRYSPCIYDYFGNFNKPQSPKRIIAYAASFGISEWEFSDEETNYCKELAQTFFSISVRENDAISICENNLGVIPQWVLDPTMLLSKEYYYKLAKSSLKYEESIFAYILDENDLKFRAIDKLKIVTECHNVYLPNRQRMSIQNWISGIVNAKYVITDSFHGCVFAIIFNKPFWVILNKERGNSRFTSLLGIFNLESRIVENTDEIDVTSNIDWTNVNKILEDHKKSSLMFLIDSLK